MSNNIKIVVYFGDTKLLHTGDGVFVLEDIKLLQDGYYIYLVTLNYYIKVIVYFGDTKLLHKGDSVFW